MTNATMIIIALATPLLISIFLTKGDTRRFISFFTLGLLLALCAVHINTYLAAAARMDAFQATIKLTPNAEEALKALPVLLYMVWRKPGRSELVGVSLACGLGFAIYENCFLLLSNTDPDLLFVLIRGFSAGVMHTICALLLGYGLSFLSENYQHMVVPGAFGLFCLVSVFHSIYNLLITAIDPWQTIGYLLPMLSALALYIWVRQLNETESPTPDQPAKESAAAPIKNENLHQG